MSREAIISSIRLLVRKLQVIRGFQTLCDVIFVYLTYRVIVTSGRLEFFGRTFSQNDAIILVVLFAIINLSLSFLIRNYRRSGRELAEQLSGKLSDQEQRMIKFFYR